MPDTADCVLNMSLYEKARPQLNSRSLVVFISCREWQRHISCGIRNISNRKTNLTGGQIENEEKAGKPRNS